jgi:hypothetical protein
VCVCVCVLVWMTCFLGVMLLKTVGVDAFFV